MVEETIGTERGDHQVHHFRSKRRGKAGSDRSDDVVRLIGAGHDEDHSGGLEIDEDITIIGVETDGHQCETRLADLTRVVAQQLDRHRRGQRPGRAVAGPRRVEGRRRP